MTIRDIIVQAIHERGSVANAVQHLMNHTGLRVTEANGAGRQVIANENFCGCGPCSRQGYLTCYCPSNGEEGSH